MKRDCGYYLEQMSAALDGGLSAEERLALDRHLAGCSGCAALFARLSRHTSALRALECPAPPGLKDDIMAHLPPQQPLMEVNPARRAPAAFWKRWGGLAACAALVLAVGLPFAGLFLTPMGSGSAAPAAEWAPENARAATGEAAEQQAAGTVDGGQDQFSLHRDDSDLIGGIPPQQYSITGDPSPAEPPTAAAVQPDSDTNSGSKSTTTLWIDGNQVSAILTLSAPPEDWQAYWSEDDVMEISDGTLYCLVEGQVMDELIQWASQSGNMDHLLQYASYGPSDLCAVHWNP